MTETCLICQSNPKAHSFKLLSKQTKKLQNAYYSCPASSELYDDIEGTTNHADIELKKTHPNRWIYLFDSRDLELKHVMQVKLILSIFNLLKEKGYINTLEEIHIINSKDNLYVEQLFAIIKPMIPKRLNDKIFMK